ncbi:MAG: ubiquitin-like domain-containing protein [Candidatus Scalinduaceae bacterium]
MEKLILTIESAATEQPLEVEVNTNQPIRALKVSTMAKLGIDPSQADNYRLIFNGNPLSEDDTIGESNVPNGATLILTPLGAVVI